MSPDSELVYSTKSNFNIHCEHCGKITSACTCTSLDNPPDVHAICAVLRLEKAHRNGKDVTLIDRLPASELFLKDFARDLKTRCGAGGTYRIKDGSGIVEIQGDKRELLRTELTKRGIRCR